MATIGGLEKARVTLDVLPPLSVIYKQAISVVTKTLQLNIAELTTATPHDLVIGDKIVVSGVGSPFDGYAIVATTPSTTTFTYSKVATSVPITNLTIPGIVKKVAMGYWTRYRIVSTDKNRYSHWSPTYEIIPPLTFSRPNGVTLDGIKSFVTNTGGNNKVITTSWDPVEVFNDGEYFRKAVAYDIWLRWDSDPWVYQERITSTSLTIARPASHPSTLSIEIYGRTPDVSRDAGHQQMLFYKRDNIAL